MSCNEKKTVMVFATGGTIAMKYDEAAGGLIPVLFPPKAVRQTACVPHEPY